MEKYYLWINTKIYGWKTNGKVDGYNTIKQLKTDNKFSIENYPYQILKAITIEEG